MNKRMLTIKWRRGVLIVIAITTCLIFVLVHHQTQPISALASKQTTWFANPLLSWTEITVKRGDSLYKIFKDNHIDYATLKNILTLPTAKHYLMQLPTGRTLYLHNDTEAEQLAIKYPIDDDHTLYIYSDNRKFSTYLANKPLMKHVLYKSITIKNTFAKSAHDAGLTYAQIHQLSDIFAGSINFSHDIHPGDKFSLLYNEYYWHDKKEKPGNILAATITNRGKTYTALRFTYPYNHSGYYTPDGHGVEPLFLRYPLHYKRISSYFSLHRYDPFLHIVHPHLGVDFAAPTGTKIKSIGNGKIIFRGRKGGYGNTVIVRYEKKYKALYGHLSRFAANQQVGSTVKKGQIIGYVGSTGWATGPHLHFGLYIHGIPRNPLTMKIIGGKSVPKDYLPAFHEKSRCHARRIENVSRARIRDD